MGVVHTADSGAVIHVAGADLMDGTPIYDIKPYIEYTDAHAGVRSGFVDEREWGTLQVVFPAEYEAFFSSQDLKALLKVLALDPRPQYHDAPDRVYGMPFAGYDVRFTVAGGVLQVVEVVSL